MKLTIVRVRYLFFPLTIGISFVAKYMLTIGAHLSTCDSRKN